MFRYCPRQSLPRHITSRPVSCLLPVLAAPCSARSHPLPQVLTSLTSKHYSGSVTFCYRSNPWIGTTGLRISYSFLQLLKDANKNSFFFLLLSVVTGTFRSVFKNNKSLRSQKVQKSRVLSSFLLVDGSGEGSWFVKNNYESWRPKHFHRIRKTASKC